MRPPIDTSGIILVDMSGEEPKKFRKLSVQFSFHLAGQRGEFQKLSYGSEMLHGVLIHKNIRIPLQKKILESPTLCYIWPDKGGIYKNVLGFQNFGCDL